MKFLFHVHTHYSYDSVLNPRSIIDFASDNGITVVAITDHDTTQGSVDSFLYAKVHFPGIEVIIGAEYLTSCGDVIGLFLKEDIPERDAEKLIEEIHRQGGIAVLPHPLKSHKLTPEILMAVDVIEIFNPRCTEEQNSKALELAMKYQKSMVAGNDAHLAGELSLCYNMMFGKSLQEAIRSPKEIHTTYTSTVNILRSQMIKGYKRGDVMLILKTVKSFLSHFIVQPLRKSL